MSSWYIEYDTAPQWVKERIDNGGGFTLYESWWLDLLEWHSNFCEDHQAMHNEDHRESVRSAIHYWRNFPMALGEWVIGYLNRSGVCLFRDRHLPDCGCEECEDITGNDRTGVRQHLNGGHCYCERCWPYFSQNHRPESEEDLLVECLINAAELNRLAFSAHHLAVDIIAEECDKQGIDSGDLIVSAMYCREFLSLKNRGKYYMPCTAMPGSWPDFLPLLELPDDMRIAIVGGVAAVKRLEVRLGLKSEYWNVGSDEEINSTESCILEALESAGPMKAEGLASKAVGKSGADGSFRASLAALKRRGLITGGSGRYSTGYAITEKGRSMLKRQETNGQDDLEE